MRRLLVNRPQQNNIVKQIEKQIEIIVKPKTINFDILDSGPYEFKIFFDKQHLSHAVNLNKIILKHNSNTKILYLTSGHSFTESKYMTHNNITLTRVNNFDELFISSNNVFYSIDNGVNDYCFIYFGKLNIEDTNYLNIDIKKYNIISKTNEEIDIKELEKFILLKNGYCSGVSYSIPVIDFNTDKYILSKINKTNYFTFKINKYIVVLQSNINNGIVVKGTTSNIDKINNINVNNIKMDEQHKYYFYNIINNFKNHELFSNVRNITNELCNKYYSYYVKNNCLSVVSLMGDSGTGFYKMTNIKQTDNINDDIELVGINIAGCSLIYLSEDTSIVNYTNMLYWDEKISKLRFNKYIIEEVHKSCHIIPIQQIICNVKKNSKIDFYC